MTTELGARLWYPVSCSAAFALFALLLARGAPLPLALYAPVLLVLGTVLLLERHRPERLEWRPDAAVIRTDLGFMAAIQVLVPRALAALLVLLLAARAHRTPAAVWPQHWPLAAQIVLMVLAVDLLRYGLHRACHRFTPLWRLHEVHHSPALLYSLNTARFHPLEKVGHFCLDTVPFVLLGVSERVIAGYFLAYAVNGIWQHSNVRLRYGWLNYLVGSAETHRWHHARDPRTAYCNFGNTTIVWDLLFGSFYLPPRQVVAEVGIPDASYPTGFWAQMVAPFLRGGPWRALKTQVADLSLEVLLRSIRCLGRRRFKQALDDPMRPQRRLLAELLRRNQDTSFGREHGFAAIRSYEDFASRVPVREYEALRPWVEAQRDRGERALTAEDPIGWLRTSGTTGQAKDVPLTPSHLRALSRINAEALAAQHRMSPRAFAGSILAITTPAREGTLANGKPWGSASGAVSEGAPALIRDKFVLPPQVLGVADSRLRYLLILRLALARRRITYIGTANASTLLTLMKVFHEHEAELLSDLRRGGFFRAADLPEAVRSGLGRRLGPAPWRADELEELRAVRPALRISDLWPELALIVVWTRSSAGLAAAALRAELGPGTRIGELGYLSSEFRGTITIGRRPESGLPTYDSHFFELIERERHDGGPGPGDSRYLTLDQLERGREYYIVVTTPSGLYRYFINDIVRVTGHLGRMPLLEFVQKGRGVTNITGEKLYESQVLSAVGEVLGELGATSRFVMMLADEAEAQYRLHVEADGEPPIAAAELGERVDRRLQAINIEYRSKRGSLRLKPVTAAWLRPGAGEAYKAERVALGQREAQFKLVALALRRECAFDLEAWVRPG